MKRLVCILVVAIALAVGLRWYLVSRLPGGEGTRAGIEAAIGKLEADRNVFSERTAAISEAAHRSGKSTVDEVAALMADADLNRLALQHMGADWAVSRSALLGSVRQVRELERMQADERTRRVRDLKMSVGQSERKRRLLELGIGAKSDKDKRKLEKAEVERHLAELRNSQTYRELIETDALAMRNADAKVAAEETVAKIAAEYRQASVMRLGTVIAGSLLEQRRAQARIDRLRVILSWLDFWPLNVLVRSPTAQ